jgi:hypothetical protein
MVFRIYVQIQKVSLEYPSDHKRITEKVKSQMLNCNLGKSIGCYVLSFSEEHNVYLQQDGFLDKVVRVADLDTNQRPINQNGLGIEFYVRHISNKLMFCNVSISSKIIFERRTKNNFEF